MNSESYVHQILNDIGLSDADLMPSIRLISGHLNLAQLNSLYNAADVYVTPYRAEGFNLPALEAQACGTPVVATRGGATDDFLAGDRYHPIEGVVMENTALKEHLTINAYVEPAFCRRYFCGRLRLHGRNRQKKSTDGCRKYFS